MNSVIFVAAVVVMVGVYSVLPLAGRRRSWLAAEEPDRDRQALEAEKRTYLRAIQDIDFEHAAGKINDRDHAELRRHYSAGAARIIGRLERPGSGVPAGPARTPAPGTTAAAGEKQSCQGRTTGEENPAATIATLREQLEQLEIEWEMGDIRNDAYFARRDDLRRELDRLADILQDRGEGHGCS